MAAALAARWVLLRLFVSSLTVWRLASNPFILFFSSKTDFRISWISFFWFLSERSSASKFLMSDLMGKISLSISSILWISDSSFERSSFNLAWRTFSALIFSSAIRIDSSIFWVSSYLFLSFSYLTLASFKRANAWAARLSICSPLVLNIWSRLRMKPFAICWSLGDCSTAEPPIRCISDSRSWCG